MVTKAQPGLKQWYTDRPETLAGRRDGAESAILDAKDRIHGAATDWRLFAEARRIAPWLNEAEALAAIKRLVKQGVLRKLDAADTAPVPAVCG